MGVKSCSDKWCKFLNCWQRKEGRDWQNPSKLQKDFWPKGELLVYNDSFYTYKSDSTMMHVFAGRQMLPVENWVRKGCICNECVISNYPESGLCEEHADFPQVPIYWGLLNPTWKLLEVWLTLQVWHNEHLCSVGIWRDGMNTEQGVTQRQVNRLCKSCVSEGGAEEWKEFH